MNRSSSDSALVLSLRPSGENNTTVTLLTRTRGILYATLYGGAKSRLRSLVSQWNGGRVFIYESPEKNQVKISDFDVKNYHESFSKNLFKSYAASLAAELAIRTKCGGSPGECWTLVEGFLDGMELSGEEQSRVGLIRFLWRYLALLGVQPQVHDCSGCGSSFLEKRFAPEQESHYNSGTNAFICGDCIRQKAEETYSLFPLRISALRYLAGISFLTPAEARRLRIDREDYSQLRELVFFLIENAVGARLNSIETGSGIL